MTTDEFIKEWENTSPVIRVKTSGSTGAPKEITVEKRRMEASARTTCKALNLLHGDKALLCLPVDFIAGKMMIVRSKVCNLHLTCVEASSNPLKDLKNIDFDFAAMVPLQVYNILETPDGENKLNSIKKLIIGGGAINDVLLKKIQLLSNEVYSTYGMTETLSHIALRRINGEHASEWYTPFDNVNVSINDESLLIIDAKDVCSDTLITNDIAELHADGRRFRILGRKDNVVCSGGIKLQIEEIENRLLPTLESNFLLTKVSDEKLGEKLVMLYTEGNDESIKKICQNTLSKYEMPRVFLKVEHIPITPNGKPARAQSQLLAQQLIAEKTQRN